MLTKVKKILQIKTNKKSRLLFRGGMIMLIEDYKEILTRLMKELNQVEEFQSSEYITLQEYYKISHRMLDKISKVTEYYQELIEEQINKL